ncbi:MAG: bifunctional phosphopantothenoylcysteine decarboxylase/phosphopantothenate--cysteine ligase CoaBC [Beijerinckiaceae bacterium]
MTPLSGKRILLVIGGGIAAYKALDLIRRLRERGASVRAAMTKAAAEFVTPLSVASLSGDKVYDALFSLTDEAEMGHIELSRDADLVVVAPATADLMAKLANGLANDLASTLLLATDKKVLVAPAMNLRMWLHPATQRNVATLKGDGVLFVGPNDGDMACGEYGPGRMAEPLEIVAAIAAALAGDTTIALPAGATARPAGATGPLAGKRVVVTSGPTHEPIDPVRYLANRSSGKQGHAIARAAAAAGADVVLISGPVALADPAGANVVHVQTAQQMLGAVESALPADIFIAAAAVADWRIAEAGTSKIKKSSGDGPPKLALVENPDILATIAHRSEGRPKLVVGFAAETDHVLDHAKRKLEAKGCDFVVANDVSPATGIMGGDTNTVHLVTRNGVESWPTLDKEEVARRLVLRLAGEFAEDKQ